MALHRKLESTANLLIIIVALLLGFVLIQKAFFSQSSTTPTAKAQPNASSKLQLNVGSTLNLPGEDWSKQSKTLVLALQTTCHFCSESAPFYKRIIDETQGRNVSLVAVLPTAVEESKAHLNQLGIRGIEVRSSPLEDVSVSGTPTLILLNNKGEVTDFWVGKLTPDKEIEVINKLNS